jgi:DnaJ-class molecular chaperone
MKCHACGGKGEIRCYPKGNKKVCPKCLGKGHVTK